MANGHSDGGARPSLFAVLLAQAVRAADQTSPAYGRILRSAIEDYNERMRRINGANR